ncbi:autotransporter outer membrane beta-barrel domain-containing protein [Stenotrophomonas maltophilia]
MTQFMNRVTGSIVKNYFKFKPLFWSISLALAGGGVPQLASAQPVHADRVVKELQGDINLAYPMNSSAIEGSMYAHAVLLLAENRGSINALGTASLKLQAGEFASSAAVLAAAGGEINLNGGKIDVDGTQAAGLFAMLGGRVVNHGEIEISAKGENASAVVSSPGGEVSLNGPFKIEVSGVNASGVAAVIIPEMKQGAEEIGDTKVDLLGPGVISVSGPRAVAIGSVGVGAKVHSFDKLDATSYGSGSVFFAANGGEIQLGGSTSVSLAMPLATFPPTQPSFAIHALKAGLININEDVKINTSGAGTVALGAVDGGNVIAKKGVKIFHVGGGAGGGGSGRLPASVGLLSANGSEINVSGDSLISMVSPKSNSANVGVFSAAEGKVFFNNSLAVELQGDYADIGILGMAGSNVVFNGETRITSYGASGIGIWAQDGSIISSDRAMTVSLPGRDTVAMAVQRGSVVNVGGGAIHAGGVGILASARGSGALAPLAEWFPGAIEKAAEYRDSVAKVFVKDASLKGGRSAIVSEGEALDVVLTSVEASSSNNQILLVSSGNESGRAGVVSLEAVGSTLTGDVKVTNGSIASVSLFQSNFNGAAQNATSISLDPRSVWNMTGDSSISGVFVNSGSLSFQHDGGAFKSLTVNGDYVGNGGSIAFNTALEGDDSSSDRLIVRGNVEGETGVQINNVGGKGALTEKGIQLIAVGGKSNGDFKLLGRAVGGQYEYFLLKGADDQNWYLRSQRATEPVEAPPRPAVPTNPSPPSSPNQHTPGLVIDRPVERYTRSASVLRPESGAYAANLQSAQTLFALDYQGRSSGQNTGRAWARVDAAHGSFDAIGGQLDVHSSSEALTIGTDLWRTASGSGMGVMLSTGKASNVSVSGVTGFDAKGKVRGEALGVFATLRADQGDDPYSGLYLDMALQRARFSNRVQGRSLAEERYETRLWQGTLESGYAIRVGGRANGGIYLEPQLQLAYSRWDGYDHVEANGTAISTSETNGLTGRVGVRVSGVTRWGYRAAEVQPFVSVMWRHIHSMPEITMDRQIVEADIPRSFGEISAGANVKFANGFSAWGRLLVGGGGVNSNGAQIGFGYRW